METKDTDRLSFRGIRKRWLLSFVAVLGIPVVGFIIALFHTRTIVTREIVQSNLTANKLFQATIDARFASGSQIAANIIQLVHHDGTYNNYCHDCCLDSGNINIPFFSSNKLPTTSFGIKNPRAGGYQGY